MKPKRATGACGLPLIALAAALTAAAQEATPDSPSSQPAAEELDRLRALPYLSASESRADQWQRGVIGFDRQRSHPGFNLFTGTVEGELKLLSPSGRTVHAWPIPEGETWLHARIAPDGDLLVLGGRRVPRPQPAEGTGEEADSAASEEDAAGNDNPEIPARSRYLMRLSWDGEVRWRRSLAAHHDVELFGPDRIATFGSERRLIPEVDPEIAVIDNRIEVFSAAGEPLASQSLYELVSSDPELFALRPVRPRGSRQGQRAIDLLHANNLEWIDAPHLTGRHPIYAAGNLAITLRHQDAVVVVHWPTRRLVWAWGPGELSGPHHAQLLADGNLLIFDNGLERRRSRVIELDPRREEIVWEYAPAAGRRFFTRSGGACQRLANGNTLVTNTNRGHAFEVTSEGEPVWEFYNPFIAPRQRRGVIVRLRRYEVDFVRQLLRQARNRGRPKTLVPVPAPVPVPDSGGGGEK